jgi:hypothetical protein
MMAAKFAHAAEEQLAKARSRLAKDLKAASAKERSLTVLRVVRDVLNTWWEDQHDKQRLGDLEEALILLSWREGAGRGKPDDATVRLLVRYLIPSGRRQEAAKVAKMWAGTEHLPNPYLEAVVRGKVNELGSGEYEAPTWRELKRVEAKKASKQKATAGGGKR